MLGNRKCITLAVAIIFQP